MSPFLYRVASQSIGFGFASFPASQPLILALGICLAALAPGTHGQTQTRPSLERRPNETLTIPENPPASEFTTERAFGSLRFTDPVGITTPPGETNRLFVLEQAGRISVITNLVSPTRTVFLDIDNRVTGGVPPNEQGLLGLAFHPGYATNRYFYVFYTPSGFNRLSRFQTSPDDPSVGMPDSEVVLINQPDQAGNHNAGDLHFGPDGYLYVSLGDEGGGNDQYSNSQRIDRDFFSGILRIDVDKRPGSLPPNPHGAASDNYAVPPDNPFVGATVFHGAPVSSVAVRTEFWAVGLRNPWRMSFDRPSGKLYVGDVGQGAREEIDIIQKGGNYGWNFREGFIAGPRSIPARLEVSTIDPIHDYPRRDGYSVTGGVVYRGDRFPEIFAHYLFADYGTGNLWALRRDETSAVQVRRIANDRSITAFGTDPTNGDVLIADNAEDTLKRLVRLQAPGGTDFPALLSETGAFQDLKTLTPHKGIVPYALNVPFWSDNARKSRWFSIPEPDRSIGFRRNGNWDLPAGSIWIKHFELELIQGVPESARRLETRFLVRNSQGIYGITYRWNETGTDASLVPEEGLDESFVIQEGGNSRTQLWHYPSRSQCLACHTAEAGYALGFRTEQLNREMDFGAGQVNQIAALSDAAYFESPVPDIATLPSLAAPDATDHSLEFRVRSYLAANCSQCHQPGGAGLGVFDARITTPTLQAGLVNAPLIHSFRSPEDRVFRSGQPDHSELLHRISSTGPDRMPPLGSTVLDQTAIDLLQQWILEDLPEFQTYADWQTLHFGSIEAPDAAPDADPDADGSSNHFEFLVGLNPNTAESPWTIGTSKSGQMFQLEFPRAANRNFEVQVTDTLSAPLWRTLNTPGNHPFFSAKDSTQVIRDTIDAKNPRFYRILVTAP